MKKKELSFYIKLAKGIACHFGSNCEVVVHDLSAKDHSHSIVAIENGHVSGRHVGDGPSRVVLETLQNKGKKVEDRFSYLTKTSDGKILKSSTFYLQDDNGEVVGIFGINYDITLILALEETMQSFTTTSLKNEVVKEDPELISNDVMSLLDLLIEQSVKLVGKPAALMTKEDKIKAIKYLDESGAFLVKKSGQRVCKYFGISKYTLYSYIDESKSSDAQAESQSEI